MRGSEFMKGEQDIAVYRRVAIDVKNTFLVLAGASLLPVLFHLIPFSGEVPIGAMLLPIFYAPFVGIVLCRPRVGIIAGLLAPVVNSVITGMPAPDVVMMLTIEMAIFTILSSAVYSRWRNFIATAPLSYLAAKFLSSVIFGIVPSFAGAQASGMAFFLRSVFTGLPGIVMLLIVNWILVVFKKRVGI